ncbi:pathogenesis related protein [Microchaete diplosiphon NIES-3275]|nr:pathogenesis related protein [Microchaete diplosiphon NIES-3275]
MPRLQTHEQKRKLRTSEAGCGESRTPRFNREVREIILSIDSTKASAETFESSAQIFHSTFPQGFPWEVLEVYSGPPTVTFKWRHWGHFQGAYKDHAPTGETVEIIGMSVAKVTDDLRIISVEHYFDNTLFLEKLTAGGKLSSSENKASACPFSSWFKKLKKS